MGFRRFNAPPPGRFYLGRIIGQGTLENAFRASADLYSMVDLRGDVTQAGGPCVFWTPAILPVQANLIDLGDDPRGALPIQVRKRLENELKLTLDRTDDLGDVVAQLLINHVSPIGDKSRPNALRFLRGKRIDPKDGFVSAYRGIYLGPPGFRIWEQYYKGGPGTALSDDFNRADSSSLGSNWDEFKTGGSGTPDLQIVSNTLQQVNTTSAAAQARNTNDLAGDDHYSAVDIVHASGEDASEASVTLRCSSSAITNYQVMVRNDGAGSTYQMRIGRRVSGSFTEIASYTSTGDANSSGVTLRGEVSSSDLEGFINGVSRRTATDTNITSGPRVGVDIYQALSSSLWTLDNWIGGDLGGTAALEQADFRWRNDDDDESSASWRQIQNTDDEVGVAKNIRLRTNIEETAGGDPASAQATLQYKRDDEPSSEWRDV